MDQKEPMFEYLETIAELIPAPLFWLDLKVCTIGLNTLSMKEIGAAKKEDLIGKNPYEMYKNKDIADGLEKTVNKVIQTGESLQTEDMIVDVITGKLKYYSATRAPLRNKKGEIIGVVGTAINITAEKEAAIAQKEAERLKLESEANKSKMLQLENEALQAAHAEQEKFRTIVAQMMHDITSPLTSLDTIIRQVGSNLPEADRVTLRSASDRISGIANSLLSKYKNVDSDENVDETLLASLALIQILNEKKYEHGDKPIKFEVITKESSNFRFIKMNGASFKRMVSNIINNAVDALGNTPDASININLGDNGSKLILTIKDNGPGMPEHIQEKFKQGIGITEGKAKGHGLGLTQVKSAVEAAGGRIDIIASSEHGTRIVLVFPIIPNPAWLATEIKLTKDDTVVILDDDESIHGSWDSKFAPVLEKIPTLKIQHFTGGQDAIAFINSKTPEEQQAIFLLTDKELLNQDVDGLGVIEQIKIKRAILVTSYATQTAIQTAVIQAGIKLLPKELSHAAIITVDKKIPKWSKNVDMVWLEDQTWFLDDLVERYYKHLQVDKYYDPVSLMEDIHQYPLDTRIILDTYYETVDKIPYAIDGFRLAKQLHELGYTNLILYGGEDPGNVPEYLKVVLKSDRDMIDKLDRV